LQLQLYEDNKLSVNVVFFAFGKAIKSKIFSANGQNPGVGGTQFATIILALKLANVRSNYQIYLCSDFFLRLQNSPKNLKQISIKDFFNDRKLFDYTKTIFICIDGILHNKKLLNKLLKYKIVNWIHHPFKMPSYHKNLKFSAHVSVGTYQYFSNNVWYKPHWHIPYLFNTLMRDSLPKKIYRPNETMRLVFLGALVLGKGFHYIAREWPKIKKKFPNVRLDVIGSTKTHDGKDPENKIIPTTNSYAKEILKYITDEDLQTKRVVFHGNLGKEKFRIIKKAHFAILNPTGRTEALPASTLECLMCGTPVIASNDYGMSDFMRDFPECSLGNPSEITNKLITITNNSSLYLSLQKRSLLVAKSFLKKTPEILSRWQQLIDTLVANKIIKNNPPTQSFVGNQFYLIIRIVIRSIIVILKFIFNKLLKKQL
jgi:glycosyltransferase involved in cell wall biosynthesis